MEEAVIKIDIEGGSSSKTLGDLKKEIQAIENESQKVGDNLADGVGKVETSTKSLKAQLREMKAALATLPEGSAEFRQMAQAAAEVQDQITMINNSVASLADNKLNLVFQGFADAGQAVAGAFQASQGAMALFGTESEKVQEAIQNVIAVQGILNGVQMVNNALQDDAIIGMKLRAAWTNTVSVATAAYNLVIGTSTGLMKAFKIALIATGIGAIVVALGLLIGNFEAVSKWVKDSIAKLMNLKTTFLLLLGPIGWIILAYRELFGEEDKLDKAREKQSKANRARYDERVRQIKKEREEFVKAKDYEIDALNLQIDTLEAEGKATEKIRLQVLQAERDKIKATIDSNRQMLQAKLEFFEAQAQLNGKSNEDYARSIGVDFNASVEMYSDLLDEQETALQYAENKITKFTREQNEKRNADAKKYSDEKNAELQKSVEDELRIKQEAFAREQQMHNDLITQINKLESEYYDSLLTDQQREENAIREKYFNLIGQAEQYGEDATILKESQEAELLALEQKYRDLSLEADKETFEKRIEQQKELAENTIQGATDLVNIIDSINTIANNKEIDRLKKRQEAGEKLSKKEEQKLKRDVAMQKAFAIAKIAIDTATSLTSAIAGATASAAATGPGAVVATPLFIASQIATVLGAVGSALAILNAPTPSISQPSNNGSPTIDTNGVNSDAPNTDLFNTGSTLLNAPPTKVYVLEQDISNSQNNVAAIKQQATYG
jgi:hypothetical protein